MILPAGTPLGNLHILEVWDFYDVPRLFVAQSASRSTYVVFWTAQTDHSDEWLYAAVSDIRLEGIRSGKIALREAFASPEDDCVFVVTTESDGSARVTPIRPTEIEPTKLPAADDMVRLRVDEAIEVHTTPSTHQASIHSVARGLEIPFDAVTDVLGVWRALFVGTMEALGATGALTPVAARVGSFAVTLRVDDPNITDAVLTRIADALEIIEREADAGHLMELGVDLSALVELLEVLQQYAVRLEIRKDERDLIFSPTTRPGAERLNRSIREGRLLDTADIPQADEIERVFRVLELKAENSDVTSYTLGVVGRQVSYYKQACRLLGYLDDANELTAAGHQLVRLDPPDRLRTTAIQFEQSECGFAWLRWSGVRHLPEVAEDTATRFLEEASLLGRTTAPRRASTLRAWYRVLVPFHYRFGASE